MTENELKKMTKLVNRVMKAKAVPEILYKDVEFSDDEQEFIEENEVEFYNALNDELEKQGMKIDDHEDEDFMLWVENGMIYVTTATLKGH